MSKTVVSKIVSWHAPVEASSNLRSSDDTQPSVVKRRGCDKYGNDKKGVYPQVHSPVMYAPVSNYRAKSQLIGRMGSVSIVGGSEGLRTKAVAKVNSLPAGGYVRPTSGDVLKRDDGYVEEYRPAKPTWSGTRLDKTKHAKGLRKLGRNPSRDCKSD